MADDSVSRRRWLTALGATGAVSLAGCTGGNNTQDNVSGKVKIGVLQPTSGDLKYYGQQSLWGFYSGLAYKGDTDPIESGSTGTYNTTAGDVDYELVVRDTQFSKSLIWWVPRLQPT
jgi:branched-chain amino acid transport system substrate-binding protein